jgi:hypothetical protein
MIRKEDIQENLLYEIYEASKKNLAEIENLNNLTRLLEESEKIYLGYSRKSISWLYETWCGYSQRKMKMKQSEKLHEVLKALKVFADAVDDFAYWSELPTHKELRKSCDGLVSALDELLEGE